MAAPVDMKRLYAQAERCPLDHVSRMGGRRCNCLPRSQSCGGVHTCGNVGERLGGIGVGIVVMLMYLIPSSVTRVLSCCPCGTACSDRVCQNNWKYMPGGARYLPDLGHSW